MSLTWDDYTGSWDSYGEMPITFIQIIVRELEDWLPLTPDRILKTISQTKTEALTMTGSIVRQATKNMAETLHLTEAISFVSNIIRTLTDTLGITEYDWTWDKMTLTWDDYTQAWDEYRNSLWIRIVTLKSVSDAITLTESITRKSIKVLTEEMSLTETITKVIKLIRSEALKMTEYLSFQMNLGLIFIDALTLTENLVSKFKEFFRKAQGRIRNIILSGIIKSERVDGLISNSPNISGKISQVKPEGKIKDQTLIGKIDQN
jgi:hypothetical protein